jgi:hypothetical protein
MWRDYLPDDVRIALERFHADQPEPVPDREVITTALRYFLMAHGYLGVGESQDGGGSATSK